MQKLSLKLYIFVCNMHKLTNLLKFNLIQKLYFLLYCFISVCEIN